MAQKMAKKTRIAIIASAVAVVIVATVLIITFAKPNDNGNDVFYNNENDPLVFSSQEVDKVFNPFLSVLAFSTKTPFSI